VTTVGAGLAEDIVRRFETDYTRRYSVDNSASQVDLVNLRLTVIGDTPKPRLPRGESRSNRRLTTSGRRSVQINGERMDCDIYDRESLANGDTFDGPAIVEQYDTTTLIPSGFGVTVDDYLNLIGRALR
jgi:N-methylhydantoinase A